jgi:hypothetical protein
MAPSPAESSRAQLAEILQLAYSGELAAAYAYGGHWRSVRDPGERERIRAIEAEELHHRELVGGMLRELGIVPKSWRERRAGWIGRSLALGCHLSGYLAPMYGAGKLESRNVREYEVAARCAWGCGRREWVDCLLTMAEVEWDHESYFRGRVLGHWLGRRLRLWPASPPKEEVRGSFLRETGWRVPAMAEGGIPAPIGG